MKERTKRGITNGRHSNSSLERSYMLHLAYHYLLHLKKGQSDPTIKNTYFSSHLQYYSSIRNVLLHVCLLWNITEVNETCPVVLKVPKN